MKIREYFLSVREQLEEYIGKLESALREAKAEIDLKDKQIELLQVEGSRRESEIEQIEDQRKLLLTKYDDISHRLQKVSLLSATAGASSDLPNTSESNSPRLLEIISHEFSSAIVGIRSNVSFLQRRFDQLDREIINVKLGDLMLDSEILMLQLKALQHTFGLTSELSRMERTHVFKDVVIKIVHQLKPMIRAQEFDTSNIEYDALDANRIIVEVDKVKLNQAVFNILLNSIKYAEVDPAQFRIRINVSETQDHFLIIFKDWGIGVKSGLEEKIFEEGFRAPEARHRYISGAGLGLSIARRVMRDIGGDLMLTHNRKPTEFQLLLPKGGRRYQVDSHP